MRQWALKRDWQDLSMLKQLTLTGAIVFILAGCTTHAPKGEASSCPMMQINGQWRCAPRLPDRSAWTQVPDSSLRGERTAHAISEGDNAVKTAAP
jgi:hypothetical protein